MDASSLNIKKTVKVCGVWQLLQDQIEKEFQRRGNTTGYKDDVNNLRICPNGEDYILVEFVNDISDPSPVGKILKIHGTELKVEQWEPSTDSTKDLKSENDISSVSSASGTRSSGKAAGSKSRSKHAREHKINQLRFGPNPEETPMPEDIFTETKVKLSDDVAKKIEQNPKLKDILHEQDVELKKGKLRGTWNSIFVAGGKLFSYIFPGYLVGNQSSENEGNISSQPSIDEFDDAPRADQSRRSNQPDESFNVSSLFLRYIISYHYEEYQKLENVSKEISFEVSESMADRKLKIFAREDANKNTFSKTVDKFIDFYQNQNQKMLQEIIPKENKDIIFKACTKFSLVIDAAQSKDKMVIYGERDKVQEALKFLKSKDTYSTTSTATSSSAPKEETRGSSSKTATRASSPNSKSPAEEKVIVDKFSCVLYETVKVCVYQSDITEEKADVIVNPANGELKHSGGAAAAIVKAGGKIIQDESNSLMKKRYYRNLKAGEVALTRAGNLPCNLIIHAVGPQWADYYLKDNAKRDLYNAVCNCLTTASQNGATSISIPAISSGIYGVPVDICAAVLFTAVTDFARNATNTNPLKEIRFVNIDKPTYQAFAQEMKKRFGPSIKQESIEISHSNDGAKKPVGQQNQFESGGKHNPMNSSKDTLDTKKLLVSYTEGHSTSGNDNTGSKVGNSRLNPTALPFVDNHFSPKPPSYSNAVKGKITKGPDKTPAPDSKDVDKHCSICLGDITDKKTLDKCGHSFCAHCINEAFKHTKKCPVCSTVYGTLIGNQPRGNMHVAYRSTSLPGFESCGTNTIYYRFPDGTQGPNHPNPGKPYTGTERRAYLPDNKAGRKVLQLLRKAFNQKLTFTIGRSVTTGMDNCVIWNDIHHKTAISGGPTCFGYPDPTYLSRVQEELAAKGITE